MVKKCLIDTSVVIQAQRGNVKFVKALTTQENPLISVITACEVIMGSTNKHQLEVNKITLHGFEVLAVDKDISFMAYDILEKYSLKTYIGIADALIAATAIVKKYPLWTLNKKHFRLIKEVELL